MKFFFLKVKFICQTISLHKKGAIDRNRQIGLVYILFQLCSNPLFCLQIINVKSQFPTVFEIKKKLFEINLVEQINRKTLTLRSVIETVADFLHKFNKKNSLVFLYFPCMKLKIQFSFYNFHPLFILYEYL